MDKVLEYIQKNQMIQRGDTIVVGVSGGADSVCLLFLLKKYAPVFELSLEVVHMEHGIRGKSSLRDAAFVENLCGKWEIPVHIYHRDVPKLAGEWKCSQEEAGRRVRYEAFEEIREKIGAASVAVAHNQDDQAETILWNLIRGSTLTGLCGMPPVRNGKRKIIRPLLCLSRREIEEILQREGLECCQDETNFQDCYTRNKIRHKVLPFLSGELNAGAVAHLAETGERLSAIEAYMKEQGEKKAKAFGFSKGKGFYLEREALNQEPSAMKSYILKECLNHVSHGEGLRDLGAVHLAALERLALSQSGRRMTLPGKLSVRTEGAYLVFEKSVPDGEEPVLSPVPLAVPGKTEYGKYSFVTALKPYKNERISENRYTKWFDYDTIKNTVQLRQRQSGDYLSINGKGETKTLKKYLIDEKVSREERKELCLLADGAHILWVVGRRISEAYKVTEKTKWVLKVQVMEENHGRQDTCFID